MTQTRTNENQQTRNNSTSATSNTRSYYPRLKHERYSIFLVVGRADPLRNRFIDSHQYICNERTHPGVALDQGVFAKICFTLVSASADTTARSAVCRFLQRFICKVMVFPRRPRIEDQEVNSFETDWIMIRNLN